ncbi:MAG: hypothetical protein EOO77_11040 [Oxalobacteraceae bacterium]|nr:MAG: hypothetical protein EOO77_11040 [Oxalobacteraceae bacterium]
MSDQPNASNGADNTALNGTGTSSSTPAPVPARTERPERRSFLDTSRTLGRDRDRTDTDYDFGRVGSGIEASNDTKLAATTRMVNSFMGYIKDACGRDADKLTPQDVAGLGSMLSLIQSLDAKRGGH